MNDLNKYAAFLANPENMLYGVDWRRGMCEFVPVNRQVVSDLPFLDTRTLGTSEKKGTLPANTVLQIITSPGFSEKEHKCDFLFHTAFCCSTMIARCLDREGTNLALKEPFPLLGLSGFKRNFPNFDPQGRDWQAWREIALFLLSRPFLEGERTLIKPSNGANNILPDMLSHPRCGKVILLYGGLEDFLVSVISGGPDRQAFVEGILQVFLKDFADGFSLTGPQIEDLAPLQKAALVWGLQMRFFENSAKKTGSDHCRSLDCADFLKNPGETLKKLNEFYGYGFSGADIDQILKSPAMTRHAKDPRKVYSTQDRDREKEKIRAEKKNEIETAMEWAVKKEFNFPKILSHRL